MLNRVGRIKPAARVLRAFRNFPLTRRLLLKLLGYRRPFNTLREASEAAARFYSGGHATQENANRHLALAAKPRPSDYAALFHLHSILPEIERVFDLGGNVGNLFYCYSNYLPLPTSLNWIVYDLPGMLAMGADLARSRKEPRLRFTDSFQEADGVDLLIASGSLHYFERPLGEMLADFERKPKYVLINRTPLVMGKASATVQEAEHLLAACNLFNRDDLLQGLQNLGYEALDSWRAEELSLQIPCYPEFSVPAYSGMFLELKSGCERLGQQHDCGLVGLSVPE